MLIWSSGLIFFCDVYARMFIEGDISRKPCAHIVGKELGEKQQAAISLHILANVSWFRKFFAPRKTTVRWAPKTIFKSRWWFQIFLIFTPIWGIFQMGWFNHQPDIQRGVNLTPISRVISHPSFPPVAKNPWRFDHPRTDGYVVNKHGDSFWALTIGLIYL